MKQNLHHPPEELRQALSMSKEKRCNKYNIHTKGPLNGFYDLSPPPTKPNYASDPCNPLDLWLSSSRTIVKKSSNSTINTLIQACRYGIPITISYQGGSQPGSCRTITPHYIFTTDYPNVSIPSDHSLPINITPSTDLYLNAYCHNHQQTRTFKINRITIVSR